MKKISTFKKVMLHIWWAIMFDFQSSNPVSKEWDKVLSKMLDDELPITVIDQFTCKIGDYTIWIANYPYGYGYIWESPVAERTWKINYLPSQFTRYRLKQAIWSKQKDIEIFESQFNNQ